MVGLFWVQISTLLYERVPNQALESTQVCHILTLYLSIPHSTKEARTEPSANAFD